ncbi:MAG: glycosyltransferase [Bacilli bacterium]
MKKIFWCVQQLDKIGGTEMVTIDIMNHLCDYYDITLICTSKISGPIQYELNPKLKVVCLNVPNDIARFDEYKRIYNEKHQYFKTLGLIWRTLYYFIFHRHHYRKLNKNRMCKDDLYIASSLDSYDYAPKGRNVYFHFHFDEDIFNSKSMQLYLGYFRKPDKYIFLTKGCYDEVIKKHKKLKDNSVYIYNPIRFPPTLNLDYHNNSIMFCGRFHPQKDPLFALSIANVLHERDFEFTLNMYGSGSLEDKMKSYINEHHLENNVVLHPMSKDIEKAYLSNDLLLISSTYEGCPLIRGEATAFSMPFVSTNWGVAAKELCNEGMDGFVIDKRNAVDFANKIMEIFADKDKLKLLKRSAFEESKKYSYDSIIPIWRNDILK